MGEFFLVCLKREFKITVTNTDMNLLNMMSCITDFYISATVQSGLLIFAFLLLVPYFFHLKVLIILFADLSLLGF